MFRGETSRGLLLNAYAFGKMADIAGHAATAAFAGAGLSLAFSLLGFYHASKVTPDGPGLEGPEPAAFPCRYWARTGCGL